ncbi:hypothetical protein BD310DRAFT_920945 [Dichomitus squalens]|uniref:Uncharacterized protein n=1 Tax=Dichomitus squalens TaxID=114155 RepID=A0A4Q9Q2R0_9APHY|nr:hypothetical protein BD310DRAFT_920945 [Dichomitus squalens]
MSVEFIRSSRSMLHTFEETSKCSHLELVLEDLPDVPYEDSPMWLGKLCEPVYLRTSDRSEISHLQCSQNRCDALIRGDDPAPLYPIASNMCFSLHFPCLLLDRELHWVVYSHEQTTEASRLCEQHSRRNGACMVSAAMSKRR